MAYPVGGVNSSVSICRSPRRWQPSIRMSLLLNICQSMAACVYWLLGSLSFSCAIHNVSWLSDMEAKPEVMLAAFVVDYWYAIMLAVIAHAYAVLESSVHSRARILCIVRLESNTRLM